ncbi:hypothetical protein CRD60_05230 [Bifidobacterium aemilianum]|uniref:Beta-carotene 15,15'-monooxygenase n=1 Tax=Bifidobacterium aemilianum TaxID=2493120 RepID=A0A366K7C6_9BIFI|nr:hypothetical protein CRD60_05230 [Bifidobacterium aemilianum]
MLACLWLALCMAVGPIYWRQGSIAEFSWTNGLIFLGSFLVYLLIVVELVRFARGLRLMPAGWYRLINWPIGRRVGSPDSLQREAGSLRTRLRYSRLGRLLANTLNLLGRSLVKATDRWWKLALILLVGWLWVPTTLVTAFGADVRSQIREFSWAWNQWTGLKQPYIGFFSFVPMDIYPTAHYLWPAQPTYLTDQHNIVLTVIYGAVATASRYLTGTNDWGIALLSFSQFLLAVFACASCANRFFNLPWLGKRVRWPYDRAEATSHMLTHPETRQAWRPRNLIHPEWGVEAVSEHIDATSVGKAGNPKASRRRNSPLYAGKPAPYQTDRAAGPLARLLILCFFLLSPLATLSTISLTKSPLFAYAFVWWFGIGYELHMTRGQLGAQGRPRRLPTHTVLGLAVSTCLMMISAKYALYILLIEILALLLADHKRWKTYLLGLVIPVLVLHGGLTLLLGTGAVIGGDPIESRGIQLQQIARVAKLNPAGIAESARAKLAPVFNLDQMAEAYKPQDADPVKSSGIQAKKVSYRWRTVTKDDMRNFNSAWWQIVKANPTIATDAFLAKSYGYFNVNDNPYISMDYYVASDHVQRQTSWIRNWCHDWRTKVSSKTRELEDKQLWGCLLHGNLYVTLTLLLGAAELVERRWRTLAWHLPLLLLMGVMITSPANNFERHILPLAFVFGFMLLTFWRESQQGRTRFHRRDILAQAARNG